MPVHINSGVGCAFPRGSELIKSYIIPPLEISCPLNLT